MDIKNSNPLGIIGVIGAIILIVGVFLNWLTFDLGFLGSTTWNGMDVFNGTHNLNVDFKFVPLLALICGILSLIIMFVPTLKNDESFKGINNALGIIVLILSIVVVVFGILFYTQKDLTTIYTIGIGFWLTIIGGVIAMIGGLMPIVKNKLL